MAMDIPQQLRAACEAVRRKDYPLSDLIPTLQLAADVIDRQREALSDSTTRFLSMTAEVRALREEVGRDGPARQSTPAVLRVIEAGDKR